MSPQERARRTVDHLTATPAANAAGIGGGAVLAWRIISWAVERAPFTMPPWGHDLYLWLTVGGAAYLWGRFRRIMDLRARKGEPRRQFLPRP